MRSSRKPNRQFARAAHKALAVCVTTALAMFAQPGIAATCTLNVPALNFGVYDTVGDLAMTTTITVSCSGVGNGLPFDLAVSQDSGSYAPRKMQRSGSGPILDYYLYTDASRTITWGDGKTGGTGVIHGTVVKGASSANATVYGLVRGGQSVSPGSYASTAPATVTVSY